MSYRLNLLNEITGNNFEEINEESLQAYKEHFNQTSDGDISSIVMVEHIPLETQDENYIPYNEMTHHNLYVKGADEDVKIGAAWLSANKDETRIISITMDEELEPFITEKDAEKAIEDYIEVRNELGGREEVEEGFSDLNDLINDAKKEYQICCMNSITKEAQEMGWEMEWKENVVSFEKYSPEGEQVKLNIGFEYPSEVFKKLNNEVNNFSVDEYVAKWLNLPVAEIDRAPENIVNKLQRSGEEIRDMIAILADKVNNKSIDDPDIGGRD